MNQPRRVNHPTRLARFTLVMFKPQVYVTYAVLWVLALEGSAALLAGRPWHPGAGTAVRAVSVLLALLFLRMADEQKDLEYDRVHHPDRPLVRGDITTAELRAGMAGTALVLLVLNLASGPPAAVLVLALDLAYAVLLMGLERRSAAVRDGLFVNLAVTYPVQLLLSVYVYVSAGGGAGWRAVPLLAVFVCVFLHFEFARKTSWRDDPGARMYSGPLGPLPSARLAAGFAVAAVALALLLLPGRPVVLALVAATLLLPAAGWWRFRRRRVTGWPVPLAMGFVVAGYLALAVQAGVS
ncbi:hypothetical protein NX801_03550 [Streptomyces sp. LP05-1]|uniref:4-hydroxybenzoate polyprenyltransferase n=1 Tax=Streptomyces pyxinae TaxID=2970734 RepID=A0ABT2CBK1_9ACTN|nr:hypothetical protein [Streptomyces sp. LP05-1]MCS0634746.1 hypothetical protein [Streptomyces sp. LP05-1]